MVPMGSPESLWALGCVAFRSLEELPEMARSLHWPLPPGLAGMPLLDWSGADGLDHVLLLLIEKHPGPHCWALVEPREMNSLAMELVIWS